MRAHLRKRVRRERGEQLSWTNGFYFVVCLFPFVQSGKSARHLIFGRPYSKHQGYYASEDKPDFCFLESYSLTDGDRNKINKINEWELSSDGKQEVESGRKRGSRMGCALQLAWGTVKMWAVTKPFIPTTVRGHRLLRLCQMSPDTSK